MTELNTALVEKPLEEMSTKERAFAYLDFYSGVQSRRIGEYEKLQRFEEGFLFREPIVIQHGVGGTDQNDLEVAEGERLNYADEINESIEWFDSQIAKLEERIEYAAQFKKEIEEGDEELMDYYAKLEVKRREGNLSTPSKQ